MYSFSSVIVNKVSFLIPTVSSALECTFNFFVSIESRKLAVLRLMMSTLVPY